MPFVKMEGVEGMVWAPEYREAGEKKHPCADCFFCQFCSDERCAGCLNTRADAVHGCSGISASCLKHPGNGK